MVLLLSFLNHYEETLKDSSVKKQLGSEMHLSNQALMWEAVKQVPEEIRQMLLRKLSEIVCPIQIA